MKRTGDQIVLQSLNKQGEKIDVSFAFQSSDELFETAKKLEEISQSDEVRKILELL